MNSCNKPGMWLPLSIKTDADWWPVSRAIDSLHHDVETIEEAMARRQQRVCILLNGGPDAVTVANRLAISTLANPTDTMADPVVGLICKAVLTQQLTKLVSAHPTALILTLVPANGRIIKEEIENFSLPQWYAAIRRQMQKVIEPGKSIIGGPDITYDAKNKVWQIHLHAVVFGSERKSLHNALRKVYLTVYCINRPVFLQEISDYYRQISYIWKNIWMRKERFVSRKGRNCTDNKPIKGPELRQVLCFWARHSIDDSVFLFRARRNLDGSFRLTPKINTTTKTRN